MGKTTKHSKLTRYFNNFWLFVAFGTITILSVSCSQGGQASIQGGKEPQLMMGSTFTGNGFLPLPSEQSIPITE